VLLPRIAAAFTALPDVRSVADLFSGTARVGHALKRAGLEVHASDQLRFALTLAQCYVATDAAVWADRARRLIEELRRIPPSAGYFTETFCVQSRYFRPENGERIDAIREEIARLEPTPELEAVALVSLMEAADRVDSTVGLQMAYLKDWAPRAFNPLDLRVPDILPGPGHAREGLAEVLAAEVDVDAAYLDPPYNQHSYLGNYHIWETLCRWDKPPHYGTACKRKDVRSRKSRFNSKQHIHAALRQVVARLNCPWLVVSFNNEGYLSTSDIVSILSEKGYVATVEVGFRRYVGAQIGIYNPSGEKVGAVSHLHNTEHLFVCGPDQDYVNCAAEAARAARPMPVPRPAGIAGSRDAAQVMLPF